MKKRTLFLVLMIFAICGLNSCNKDDDELVDNCSTVWAMQVQDELNALTNAATAFSTNQTTANCNAYKAAANAYVNALEPFGNCTTLTGAQRSEWEQAMASAQESVNNIEC